MKFEVEHNIRHFSRVQGGVMSGLKGIVGELGCLVRVWVNENALMPLGLLLLCVGIPLDGIAQPKPTWVPATTINSADGYGTLRWSVDGELPVGLFRITEEFAGKQSVSFTDQAELQIFRIDTGTYSFRVQACRQGSCRCSR